MFSHYIFPVVEGKTDGSVDPGSRDLFIDDSKPIAWPNDGCHPNNKGYTQLARLISIQPIVVILQ